MSKPIAVSGVRPSGELHIGNYLGAIKQFVALQEKYQTYFFIADLHAITEPQDPKKLAQQTLDIAALYLACGMDPEKTVLFVQSHVPQHLELAHILGTLAPTGDLNRMTQYKEKVTEGAPANFGLFSYPVLMAADILIYNPDAVPVGEDQKQHLEFTRMVAGKFNNRFGETFKLPQPLIDNDAKRIMGLDNPAKKMSKSAASANNYIGILDAPDDIRQKVKIAVTDSGSEIKYDTKNKPAISNLLVIFSQISEKSIAKLEIEFKGEGYAEFKSALADLLVEKLSHIREKYDKLAKNPDSMLKILKEGAKNASKIAEATMKEIRKKIGLLSK